MYKQDIENFDSDPKETLFKVIDGPIRYTKARSAATMAGVADLIRWSVSHTTMETVVVSFTDEGIVI